MLRNSGAVTKDYVHIRVQQTDEGKIVTTIQGLKEESLCDRILTDLNKQFHYNATVVQDTKLGQVIQLQGDHSKNVSTFLVQAGIVKKKHVKIHSLSKRSKDWSCKCMCMFGPAR